MKTKHTTQVANDLTLIELHVESATIIQGYWRGYLGRKFAASMSEEQKFHAMETLMTMMKKGEFVFPKMIVLGCLFSTNQLYLYTCVNLTSILHLFSLDYSFFFLKDEIVDRLMDGMTEDERRMTGCSIVQRTWRSYVVKKEVALRAFTRAEELKLKATAATLLGGCFIK